MTTQNNRLTPGLSNNLVQSDGVTKTQKQTIFENMSDGIITVTADGLINYVNSAATQIFDLSEESLVGQSFAETLLSSRKNKAFNRLFKKCSKKNCPSSKETATYTTPEGKSICALLSVWSNNQQVQILNMACLYLLKIFPMPKILSSTNATVHFCLPVS